jgi:hypothetical protein
MIGQSSIVFAVGLMCLRFKNLGMGITFFVRYVSEIDDMSW